jgi:hypothetical protein
MYKFIECLFGFETGDDATIKTLKVFAGVAQALFVFMFFAYCMSPVWIGWLNK